MGEPQPDAMQGLSLVALLQGRDDLEPERPIFLYRRHYEGEEIAEGIRVKGEKLGMRVGRWKLIDGPEEESLELFDLEADPEERVNLAEREPERVAGMRLRLRRFREAQARGDARPVPLSDEDRKRLEALGYVE
jgi:arylsulfatase A-like enzyme